MFLSKERHIELNDTFSAMTLEELNAHNESLDSKLLGLSIALHKDKADTFKAFIETVPQNVGFGMCVPAVVLHDKLTAISNGTQDENQTLTISDVRTLQKMVVECKPVSINQMRAVATTLKDSGEINMMVGQIEEEQRFLSGYIVRKETEASTGLEFSEEDTKNQLAPVLEEAEKNDKKAKKASAK